MNYVVTKIVKEAEVEGKYGPQIRTAFTTNELGPEKIVSAFSKFPMKVGQTIEGTVETQEKDGRTYHNFKSAPRGGGAPSADLLRVERKIDAILTELQMIRGEITKTDKDVQLTDDPFPGGF